MPISSSDKPDFVAAVSALLYAQHAGIAASPNAMDAERRSKLADSCVEGAEILFAQLQARGHVEPEQA